MSSAFTPRTRGHVPQSKFADAAKAARAASQSQQRGGRVEGKFDRLVFDKHPLWVRISPEQLYEQLLYNRETKELYQTGTDEFPARPWFEYKTHYVVSTERPHTCSSGPKRDQACRGCANRAYFYSILRKREESTNVRDEAARKKGPPVQESVRYGLAVTCLEKIFHMPVIGKGGKVRTDRDGKELLNWVPAPNSGLNPLKQREMEGKFAHNYHWSFGPVHLGQLASIDMDLWNSCASCASPLLATQFACKECNQVAYEDEGGITGADLRSARESAMKCPHCGNEDFLVPLLLCTGCDNPVEGSMLSFDLRLRRDVDQTDDTKSTFKLVEFRRPQYEEMFPKDAPNIYELIYTPLDIPKIFGPEDLSSQAFAYPEDLKKIDPTFHIKESEKKKESQSYGDDGAEKEGDPDQMAFGGKE